MKGRMTLKTIYSLSDGYECTVTVLPRRNSMGL